MAKRLTIFNAIRNNSLDDVIACIDKDPACVNAIAPTKPNDTKGMSPLQVSVTTGWHRKIAWYLLSRGADVNYMESPKIKSSEEQDEDLLRIFKFLLDSGAEKNTVSSYAKKNNQEIYCTEPIWSLVKKNYETT